MSLRLSIAMFFISAGFLGAEEIEWTTTTLQNEKIRSIETIGANTILCSTSDGELYLSDDDGRSWRAITSPATDAGQINPLRYVGPDNVYALSWENGLFRSSDFGASWARLTQSLTSRANFYDLIVLPDGGLLVGTFGEGVFASHDDGQTWVRSEELAGMRIRPMLRARTGDIYAGTWGSGLYRSRDDGTSWQSIGGDELATSILASLGELGGGRFIFAGGADGLYRSSDGGDSWVTAGANQIIEELRVYDYADDGKGTYYIGTDGGAYASTDEGLSWQPIASDLPIRQFPSVVITENGFLLAGSEGRGIFRSAQPIADNQVFAELSGRIFNDLDADCLESAGDAGLSRRLVKLEPGPYYGITNKEGEYLVYAPAGSYTASSIPARHWQSECSPKEQDVLLPAAGDRVSGIDFAHSMIPGIEEIALSISSSGWARPGAELSYCIIIRNTGTIPYSGTIEFHFDPVLNYESASLQPSQLLSELALFPIANLPVESELALKVTLSVPRDPALTGRRVCAQVQSQTSSSDQLLRGENFDEDCLDIRNSFDPNDIQVEPAGIGPQGLVPLSEQILAYTIRFQNTGNAEAIEVRVLDTLDDNLDITSLRMGVVSHEYKLIIRDDNILEFRFDNINLPDNKSDEAGSNGFIKYTIHMMPDMTTGTQIRNRAAIYFDFNAPVITNTAVTTLQSTSTSVDERGKDSKLSIYPNPSGGIFNIESTSERLLTVRMFDIHGSEVPCATKAFGKGLTVHCKNNAAGVYFLRITSNSGEVVRRIQLLD